MDKKEELLKRLLEEVDAEDLKALLEKKEEESGPRHSKITNKVLDNSGFESMKGNIDKHIPSREMEYIKKEQDTYINREVIPPRSPIKLVSVNCHRCGTSKKVPPSNINTKIDDQMVYMCPECSIRSRGS